MNIRTIVVATGLCVSVLTAGCASSVAGQAQIVPGAVLPTTSGSAPSPFPDPGSGGSSSSSSPTGDGTDGGGEDTSVGPTAPTSIPGLSKECNTVLAGITAFTKVLQGAGASETISQATVDEALEQLPASGLPSRPQADISVLRTTVAGAAGKTLAELGGTMTDGKVVDALQDLSNWAEANCT
jgi:hypothetical protein